MGHCYKRLLKYTKQVLEPPEITDPQDNARQISVNMEYPWNGDKW